MTQGVMQGSPFTRSKVFVDLDRPLQFVVNVKIFSRKAGVVAERQHRFTPAIGMRMCNYIEATIKEPLQNGDVFICARRMKRREPDACCRGLAHNTRGLKAGEGVGGSFIKVLKVRWVGCAVGMEAKAILIRYWGAQSKEGCWHSAVDLAPARRLGIRIRADVLKQHAL